MRLNVATIVDSNLTYWQSINRDRKCFRVGTLISNQVRVELRQTSVRSNTRVDRFSFLSFVVFSYVQLEL